ncbi:SDR family NAD(P)-dependent oxidoreductase [Streptomyces sp. O3]
MPHTPHTPHARFFGKAVLVTGGGSGLGRAIALAFAAEGARVVVAGRTAAALDATVALIDQAGGEAAAVTADVTRAADVRTLVRETVTRFGALDIAVNNAGVLRGAVPVADVSEEDWDTVLRTNVTGVWLAMKHEINEMRASGGGVIVNISSNLGAHLRIPNAAAYLTSKAAVSALTRAAALDHIGDGVRVNAVSPGASDGPMSLLPGETEAERAERIKTLNPLGRVAGADEVAAAVLYLASPEAGSVVGTELVVDGGSAA